MRKIKRICTCILALTLVFANIPCYAATAATYESIWNLEKFSDAIEKLLQQIAGLKEKEQTAETKAQIQALEDEVSKVTNGEWTGANGYKYAYFPTIYTHIIWQSSNGTLRANDTVVNFGGQYSYEVPDMNQYGVIDYMKSTLKIEDADIEQVILYNHNFQNDRDFPDGKVYPLHDHAGMLIRGVTKDNINSLATDTEKAIDVYINTFDDKYKPTETINNHVSNYIWDGTKKNGSFTETSTFNTPKGLEDGVVSKGFEVTSPYFQEIQALKRAGNLNATTKAAAAQTFREDISQYGLDPEWTTNIIDKVNAGTLSTSGNVQAYAYYTLQVWVVAYKDGGGDLTPSSIKLSVDDKDVDGPVIGEPHCITVEVKNTNQVAIGADTASGNGKLYPLIHIIDNLTGNEIFNKTVKILDDVPPNGTTKVKVCGVKIETPEIKVCTNVDSDKHFNDVGLNEDTSNDTLCKVFKSVQDMGMSQTMTLQGSKGVDILTPGGKHDVIVYPKHVVGNVAVGLNDTLNPKATVDLTVEKIDGTKFYQKTLIAKDILEPSKSVPVTFPDISVPSDANQIKVCATVNKIHDEKHFNLRNGNDTYCKTFTTTRNFAIKKLSVSPSLVYSAKTITKDISFSFTVANETTASDFAPAPLIVIRQNGKVIWSKEVSIQDGTNIEMTQTVSVQLKPGDNTFEVEVNPDRTIEEYTADGNPYADNKKSATVAVQRLEEEVSCSESNSSNNWEKKFVVHIQEGTPYEYQVCDSRDEDGSCSSYRTVKACKNLVVQDDSKTLKFYEKYKIKNVLFRSKYTQDHDKNGDGWVDLKNGGKAVIKSGYGFELAALVTYETNRLKEYEAYRASFTPIPPFYVNRCTYGTISPQVSSTSQPGTISLKLPFVNSSGGAYTLNVTSASGSWDNSAYLFELPERKSLTGKSKVRMIYTNEYAAVGTKSFSYTTPIWEGYQEGGVKKKKLQQCFTGYIKIIANDDLHEHLTN